MFTLLSVRVDQAMRIILFGLAARCSVSCLRTIGKGTRKANMSSAFKSSLSSNNNDAALLTNIADLRKEYSRQGLEESDATVAQGPYAVFTSWLNDAVDAKVMEPNAMCLSTCSNNVPSARFVLLKAFDDRGFVWYTNYNSRKSCELIENPNASLTFWWGDIERSVRIEGVVEKVSASESDAYFNSRPRGSQIGAWTSNQSSEIENRDKLEEQEKKILQRFEDGEQVPRPPHWGGFRLIPRKIEFWKGRESRLHDRLVFQRQSVEDDKWILKRLQP